jgi:hypothetical protein
LQGRSQDDSIQEDEHLLVVLSCIERNPRRARLVERGEHWRRSSLEGIAAAKPAYLLDPCQ